MFPLDALLFFVDVDMVFDEGLLRRVAWNTQQGSSVYFPIVFSQYDPVEVSDPPVIGPVFTGNTTTIEDNLNRKTSPNEIDSSRLLFPHNDHYGYWRQFGFGIVSIYHSDLSFVGGLDTTIEGWGKEDVDLFDKIVASNLTVFRAPDPGLVHVFHPIQCASSLPKEQAEMCRGTKLASTASWQELAKRAEEKFPQLL